MKFIDIVRYYHDCIDIKDVNELGCRRNTATYTHSDDYKTKLGKDDKGQDTQVGVKMQVTAKKPILPTGWQHPEQLCQSAQHPVAKTLAIFIKYPMAARQAANGLALFEPVFKQREWMELVLTYQLQLKDDDE